MLATNNRTAAPLNQNILLVDYVSRIGCAVGDSCRKPASGMWDYMVQHCNDGIQPGERQIYCNGCKQSQHKCHPAFWYMWTPLEYACAEMCFSAGVDINTAASPCRMCPACQAGPMSVPNACCMLVCRAVLLCFIVCRLELKLLCGGRRRQCTGTQRLGQVSGGMGVQGGGGCWRCVMGGGQDAFGG